MNQKGFANIILVVVIVILLGAVGYFAFIKKSEPVAQQTNTPNPASTQTVKSPEPTPQANTSLLTFSDQAHVQFQYPSDWKVGKFEHYLNQFTLQPADRFVPEAKADASIFISVTGHCMNTQCLTVYSLDDMVKEFGAKVLSTARAKNATGYKISYPDESGGAHIGYIFIKGKDLVSISTDIYPTYMDKIIPTLQLLAKE